MVVCGVAKQIRESEGACWPRFPSIHPRCPLASLTFVGAIVECGLASLFASQAIQRMSLKIQVASRAALALPASNDSY